MEKLKTKSELRAEFEKDAEVIRKHFNRKVNLEVLVCEHYETMFIRISNKFGADVCGQSQFFVPDLVPPADGRAVIVGTHGGMRVSKGKFSDFGKLQTHEESGSGFPKCAGWEHWCDYLNRDHHSPGWKKEWEKIR